MYSFKENSLYCGEKVLFENITLWLNTKLEPWEMDKKDKIELDFISSTSDSIVFEKEQNRFVLTLKQENNTFALHLQGAFDDFNLKGHGHHLNSLCGIGIDFDVQHTGNYASGHMDYLFWQKPFISNKMGKLKNRTQMLLYKMKADKVYLTTVCDKMFKTELFPCKDNRISLIAHSNTVCDSINEYMLIGAYGKDEYDLPLQTAEFGLKKMEKQGKLQKDKKYPEIFEYLGWCSWDAFQHHVTPEKLMDKCQEFKDKGIPVRWAIFDDTWNDVTNIDNETKNMRELNDWEAAPNRFPDGLKDCIQRIKEKYGMIIGIWHPTSGYWYGINPNGPLAKRIPELLEYTIPGFYPDGPRLMHSFEQSKIEKYYDTQYKFYKDCGADFVKVDNQGSTERFCYFKGGIGECTSRMHNAIEKAVKKHFDGTIINCMGMPVDNLWNRTYSNVNRFSGDFLPEDRKWFIHHLIQCSYNTYSQGPINTGDWDMFWSDDAQAKKNAVLRALSGGPIYVSDKLNRSIKEILMPLVFSDGRILRLHSMPKITRDCMFADSQKNGKIFKIFNSHNDTGILVAFNLDHKENKVTGNVSPKDIIDLTKGEYVMYDWFSGCYQKVGYSQKTKLNLENYDDFRLLLFTKINNGKAVLGLREKYMMPLTFEKIKGGVEVKDDGTLLVYSETEINGFNREQENIWSKQVKKGEKILI